MNPQLEFFLEEAFKSVQSTSPQIGRVVVEPDYDASPDPKEKDQLAMELLACIEADSIDLTQLTSPQGYGVKISDRYPLLVKYVRGITLHQAPVEDPWVEVAPPGNWI